ncbi:MAG: lipocalin family protein [Chryseobacterium sp.]|uniref:lipocalin family protein n=1 Tax=Chryseobacterium sp. TaxID=1871047 RepID=UPI00281C132F|nr:lipocalin family protein [Chryseobacterium sp.]MDR2238288.1 lipocalin family protein [Chryseobacterium sp.]
MRGAVMLLFVAGSLLNAQKIKKEEVTGFWKLKEAGFYEDGKKEVKAFDNCRLMRNYSIREDGYAVYNYVEGKTGDCIPGEPRLSFWRLTENRIQFFVGDQILEESVVMVNKDKTITLSSYIPERIKVDGDAMTEKMMNTIHYDILEKQY